MKNLFKNVTRHIALRRMANFFEKVERNPVIRTPKETGLDYEDVSFKSLDGVNLKGWYIPSENSDKLVIFNHFMLGNKAGAKPHEDWGNITVDFMQFTNILLMPATVCLRMTCGITENLMCTMVVV